MASVITSKPAIQQVATARILCLPAQARLRRTGRELSQGRDVAERNQIKRPPRKNMNKSPKDVDAYIAAASEGVRGKLKELRATIRKTAPDAEERISYGMPYYDYKGRLAYFAAFKKHIGLYVPTPVIEEHKSDLEDYETAKATVRFPIDKPLPVALIKKLVKARVKKNDERKRT